MGRTHRGKRRPPPVDWRTTAKVRQAVREDRWVVGPHALGNLARLGLDRADLEQTLLAGIVLSKRRRDEQHTAIDGFKHFFKASPRAASCWRWCSSSCIRSRRAGRN